MTAAETGPTSAVAAVTAAVRTAMDAAGTAPKGRRGRPPGRAPGSGRHARTTLVDGQARVTAAIVLDVLAGMRSTSAAATALDISPVRYYAIEARAIGGLIAACAPKASGPQPLGSDPKELARLTADRTRLEQETARLRAVLRSTQRHLGVKEPPVPEKPTAPGKKPRKGRRPAVRALTVVRQLMRAGAASTTPAAVDKMAGELGGG